jgi:hypothetical protein
LRLKGQYSLIDVFISCTSILEGVNFEINYVVMLTGLVNTICVVTDHRMSQMFKAFLIFAQAKE